MIGNHGFGVLLGSLLVLTACSKEEEKRHYVKPSPSVASSASSATSVKVDEAKLGLFAPLPDVSVQTTPESKAKVVLGRLLFHDKRLSKDQGESCNKCHNLALFGADGTDFSPGFGGKPSDRNTPSIYDGALEFAQFADGRAETTEDAVKAVLDDPVLMGKPGAAHIETTLRSIPAYAEAFKSAFPGDGEPVTLANTVSAISAFTRGLVTPSRWDRFLKGDATALTDDEKKGFTTFVDTGCTTCHVGALVGGTMYQILGKVKPWPNLSDKGRSRATQSAGDDMMFKVPSLRNVARTGPYFHDASAKTLADAVKKMATHQLGKELGDDDTKGIVLWLETLSADASTLDAAPPELPASTLATPKSVKK
jgi:cytochrome c peroxidase